MTIDWTPGIGDPTLVGWMTVVAYLGTAFICAIAAKAPSLKPSEGRRDCRFWVGVVAIFSFLAINKQLDLQSLLTDIGRNAAMSGGWYGNRHAFQAAFVALVGVFGAFIMAIAIWRVRFQAPPLKLALCGIGFICTFIVVRAASFHHVDMWLGTGVVGLRWNWLIELGGIVIVASAALWSCLQRLR